MKVPYRAEVINWLIYLAHNKKTNIWRGIVKHNWNNNSKYLSKYYFSTKICKYLHIFQTIFNPSNAEATIFQSTMTQIFLKTI